MQRPTTGSKGYLPLHRLAITDSQRMRLDYETQRARWDNQLDIWREFEWPATCSPDVKGHRILRHGLAFGRTVCELGRRCVKRYVMKRHGSVGGIKLDAADTGSVETVGIETEALVALTGNSRVREETERKHLVRPIAATGRDGDGGDNDALQHPHSVPSVSRRRSIVGRKAALPGLLVATYPRSNRFRDPKERQHPSPSGLRNDLGVLDDVGVRLTRRGFGGGLRVIQSRQHREPPGRRTRSPEAAGC
jgi:hypothetical protein